MTASATRLPSLLVLLALLLAGCLPPAATPPPVATPAPPPSATVAPTSTPVPTPAASPTPTQPALEDILFAGERWFSFCHLLTLREVATHTGLAPEIPTFEDPLLFPVGEPGSHVAGCNYWPSAALGLYFPGPQEDLRASFETGSGVPREAVAGLGEAAYWEAETGLLDVLAAEGYWLRLQVHGGPDFRPGTLDAARPLAELALGRLPGLLYSPTPTPYPALEACAVLAEAEAEAILGRLTEAPRVETAIGEGVGVVDACTYTGERGFAWVSFRRVRPPENAEYVFEVNAAPDAEPISGLGDEAHWSAAQGALSARRGGLLLSVVLAAPEAEARNMAVEVARAALARIP